MGRVAILTCILGDFDTAVDPVMQDLPEGIEEVAFHRFTYDNFPKIADMSARLQYRIPKLFGWQMFPGYDYYIWLDGRVSLRRKDCLEWYLKELGDADMAFFKHPNRSSVAEEVEHIDSYMKREKGTRRGQDYLLARYENGLHNEQLADIQLDPSFVDDKLYASTAFIYKDSEQLRDAMRLWWLHQSRYFTCDQIALMYAVKDLKVNILSEPIYQSGYISLVSHHR